jgi:hypothetical protein
VRGDGGGLLVLDHADHHHRARRRGAAGCKIQKLQVLNVSLSGTGPWTSWFGARRSARSSSLCGIRQRGLLSPPLVLAIGNAGDTTTPEAATQNLPTFGPNAARTLQMPVSLSAVSIGEHRVVVIVGNAGLLKAFKVQN